MRTSKKKGYRWTTCFGSHDHSHFHFDYSRFLLLQRLRTKVFQKQIQLDGVIVIEKPLVVKQQRFEHTFSCSHTYRWCCAILREFWMYVTVSREFFNTFCGAPPKRLSFLNLFIYLAKMKLWTCIADWYEKMGTKFLEGHAFCLLYGLSKRKFSDLSSTYRNGFDVVN